MDFEGHIVSQFVPEEPISNQLKLAQYEIWQDRKSHLGIARVLIETKLCRQAHFLKSLKVNFPSIEVPKLPLLTKIYSEDFLRNAEARYAESYFNEIEKAFLDLGQEFTRRSRHSNQHANDLINSLLNYGYAILKVYVRRAINSVDLDNSISFLHFISKGERSSLTFDLMELWRTNIDYSVIQTLEEIRRIKGKKFGFTDEYDVEITKDTAKLLIEKITANLSLEEIISNTRIIANYLLGKIPKLSFHLKSIPVKESFETEEMKSMVLTKSYRELGMNKSTLWYQRRRLEQSGSLRVYNNTKRHFV